ncbi:MAG TPA: hypothetical protein DCY13_01885 [Verrucomicrobiales bacterium]|nr:hypothetical protein [Verrucomicrobiales bacterium]
MRIKAPADRTSPFASDAALACRNPRRTGSSALPNLGRAVPLRRRDPHRAAGETSVGIRDAFTLIEVLLAIAVSAVVLAVINGVYFGALQLRNRTTATFAEALPLEHAVALIKRDLECLMPPGGTLVGDLQSNPSATAGDAMPLLANAERVSPDFHTSSGRVDDFSSFADVQRVAYYLAEPEVYPGNAGRDLYRVITRNLLPATVEETQPQYLMGGVEQMTWQYLDGSYWVDAWDTTISSNLPAAIKLSIVPAARDGGQSAHQYRPIEMVVPLLIVARTNAATAAGGGQ